MYRWILLVALAPAVAHADDRCAQGEALAHKGDLPRAALYLDGCDGAAARDVKKKLEASELSKLDIVTTPAGLSVEIDALPGEPLTTPATVWVRAGHHVVKGERVTGAIDVKPRTHATLVLDAAKPPAAATAGHVSFEEENAGEVSDVGKLPDVKHRPMLNCKYTASCPASGDQIDDPLALAADVARPYPSVFAAAHAGVSSFAGGLQISGGVELAVPITASERPWLAIMDYDFAMRTITDFSGAVAIGKVIAAPDTCWLSAGIGGGYSSYGGLEGEALVDLALRRLPVMVAARYRRQLDASNVFGVELGAYY